MRRVQQSRPETLEVTDNWPDSIAVSVAEIDVIETYFGDLLDEILGARK